MLEAFSYLRSSPVFKIVRFNNNIADGKAPYNLHLNCYFWPKACAEPINVEILFFVKTVHNLQHRQRLAKDLRRIRGVHDIKRLDVVEEAGHCPHDEEPEKTNKLINEFIQETK